MPSSPCCPACWLKSLDYDSHNHISYLRKTISYYTTLNLETNNRTHKRIEKIVSLYITQYKMQCVACIMITPALPHIGIGNVWILMNVVGLTYNYTGLLQPVVWNYGRGPECRYGYRPILWRYRRLPLPADKVLPAHSYKTILKRIRKVDKLVKSLVFLIYRVY
jgi:hypothetical protein